MRDDRFRLV